MKWLLRIANALSKAASIAALLFMAIWLLRFLLFGWLVSLVST